MKYILQLICSATIFMSCSNGPSVHDALVSKSNFPCVVISVVMNDTVKSEGSGLYSIKGKRADGTTWDFGSNEKYHVGTTLTLTIDTTQAYSSAAQKVTEKTHTVVFNNYAKKDTTTALKDSVQ